MTVSLHDRTIAAIRKLQELVQTHERRFIRTEPLGRDTPPALDATALRESSAAIREAHDELQRLFVEADRP